MGCTLVLRIRQAHDLEHLANVFLRHAAHRLHNAQIFLAGKMAVIARAFNETAHLLEDRQPIAAHHRFAEHSDVAGGRPHKPEDHLQRR